MKLNDDENSNIRQHPLFRSMEDSWKLLKFEDSYNLYSYHNAKIFQDPPNQNSQYYDNHSHNFKSFKPHMSKIEDEESSEHSVNDDLNEQNQQKKGLRYLANKVSQIVRNEKKTTYKEVSNQLVSQVISKNFPVSVRSKEQKNIKRRVYDALNVLISVEVIQKIGKYIYVKEQTSIGKCLTRGSYNNFKSYESKIEEQNKRIQKKKQYLAQLSRNYLALNKLKCRNMSKGILTTKKCYPFPLILIKAPDPHSLIDFQKQNNITRFNFTKKFTLRGDLDLISLIFKIDQKEIMCFYNDKKWIV